MFRVSAFTKADDACLASLLAWLATGAVGASLSLPFRLSFFDAALDLASALEDFAACRAFDAGDGEASAVR